MYAFISAHTELHILDKSKTYYTQCTAISVWMYLSPVLQVKIGLHFIEVSNFWIFKSTKNCLIKQYQSKVCSWFYQCIFIFLPLVSNIISRVFYWTQRLLYCIFIKDDFEKLKNARNIQISLKVSLTRRQNSACSH